MNVGDLWFIYPSTNKALSGHDIRQFILSFTNSDNIDEAHKKIKKAVNEIDESFISPGYYSEEDAKKVREYFTPLLLFD